MRRKSFDSYYKISVKFSDTDGVSEGAVEEGGPTRKTLLLGVRNIKDSQMFIETNKKYIPLNRISLNEFHYHYYCTD